MTNFILSFLQKYKCEIELLLDVILDDEDLDDHSSIDLLSNDTIDESTSELDNESSTLDNGLDNKIIHSRQPKKQDGIGIIVGIIGGDSSNGGDSSTADSPINRILRGYMIKTFINGVIAKITEVFCTIMVIPYIDTSWISTEFTPGFIGQITGVLATIIVLVFPHSGFITMINAFIKNVKSMYNFDILFRAPSYGMGYYSLCFDIVGQLIPWHDAGALLPWTYKVKLIYSLSKFKKIKDSLGLVCMHNIIPSYEWIHRTHMGAGLKTLLDNAYQTVLVQVETLTYNSHLRKYVYGYFNVLVFMGFAVTVWYKYLPGELPLPPEGLIPHEYQPPEGLRPHSYGPFKDPTSVVEGYKKVSYMITKDIIQTVITTYQQQTPFKDIINTEVFDLNSPFTRERFASVGTAVMIAAFLTTKVLIPVPVAA